MPGFEDLSVWKRSVELSADVYRSMAGCSDYGFRDQITRSCLSIPSNIAEGLERYSWKDQIKFLDYSRGSSAEFRTQAIVGSKANILSDDTANRWTQESTEISKMIAGLIRSIREKNP